MDPTVVEGGGQRKGQAGAGENRGKVLTKVLEGGREKGPKIEGKENRGIGPVMSGKESLESALVIGQVIVEGVDRGTARVVGPMIEVKRTEIIPRIEETVKTEEINVKDQGTNRLIEINEVQEEKLTLKPRRR